MYPSYTSRCTCSEKLSRKSSSISRPFSSGFAMPPTCPRRAALSAAPQAMRAHATSRTTFDSDETVVVMAAVHLCPVIVGEVKVIDELRRHLHVDRA
jgi:hypothetical protein